MSNFVTLRLVGATIPGMQKLLVVAALLAAVALTGCARARVTTEIRPDGSFTRTDVFTGQEKKDQGMQMAPTLEETFLFPSSPEWKASSGTLKSDVTKTFVRTVSAGGTLKGDLSVRQDKGSQTMKLVNEVTVTRVGPKRFEYRETLRWTGPPPKDSDVQPNTLATIKAALPPALATDANARSIGQRAYAIALPMLFGPDDLLLSVAVIHPDLAERRAHQRMGAVLLKALEEQFGDKLTLDQRREIARKLVESAIDTSKPSQPGPSSGGDSKDSSAFTPLTFILRAPGKLISSNGEYDELSGEVYWALFPEGASMKPVVLTAVYEQP